VGSGTVDRASGWLAADTNVTLLASPMAGYAFQGWSGDTGGCAIASNTLAFTLDRARGDVVATFQSASPSLTIYSVRGTTYPPVGMTNLPYGTNVTCSMLNSPLTSGGTQYVCTGWTGSGRVGSGQGTNVSVTLTNDSTLTWLWQTNYYLSVTNVGSGTVDRASGWLAADTNVTLLASPMAGYAFQGWSGSTGGCTIAGTNIGVVADGPRAITAEFAVVSNPYTAYGTPYAWLALYYASNLDFWDTNDSDGDTMLGWMEHVTGTIPTNPLSVFRVLDVRTFGGSNRVMWYGTTNGGVTNAWSMYRATNLMMTPSPWALVVTSGIPRHASGTNTWWDLYPPAAAPILYRPMAVWTNHP
jgi:hypothetical protein